MNWTHWLSHVSWNWIPVNIRFRSLMWYSWIEMQRHSLTTYSLSKEWVFTWKKAIPVDTGLFNRYCSTWSCSKYCTGTKILWNLITCPALLDIKTNTFFNAKAHGLASVLFGYHMDEIDDETMLFCSIILERELKNMGFDRRRVVIYSSAVFPGVNIACS